MNEQPRNRLNAGDPSPYVIGAIVGGAIVLIAIAGWFMFR